MSNVLQRRTPPQLYHLQTWWFSRQSLHRLSLGSLLSAMRLTSCSCTVMKGLLYSAVASSAVSPLKQAKKLFNSSASEVTQSAAVRLLVFFWYAFFGLPDYSSRWLWRHSVSHPQSRMHYLDPSPRPKHFWLSMASGPGTHGCVCQLWPYQHSSLYIRVKL